MTTKDYQRIAKHLHAISYNTEDGRKHEAYGEGFGDAVVAIADAFEEDNDRFDPDKFLEAVYRGS